MEPTQTPLEMPAILRDLVTFINRWPGTPNVWKRFRVALKLEEVDQLRTYFRSDNGKQFIYAIRGVPIITEEHPEFPLYLLEPLEGFTRD